MVTSTTGIPLRHRFLLCRPCHTNTVKPFENTRLKRNRRLEKNCLKTAFQAFVKWWTSHHPASSSAFRTGITPLAGANNDETFTVSMNDKHSCTLILVFDHQDMMSNMYPWFCIFLQTCWSKTAQMADKNDTVCIVWTVELAELLKIQTVKFDA